MVSTKTNTHINTRLADCNVTGVFVDVFRMNNDRAIVAVLQKIIKARFPLNTQFRTEARLLLIYITDPGEWLRHLNACISS